MIFKEIKEFNNVRRNEKNSIDNNSVDIYQQLFLWTTS